MQRVVLKIGNSSSISLSLGLRSATTLVWHLLASLFRPSRWSERDYHYRGKILDCAKMHNNLAGNELDLRQQGMGCSGPGQGGFRPSCVRLPPARGQRQIQLSRGVITPYRPWNTPSSKQPDKKLPAKGLWLYIRNSEDREV